MTNSILPDLLPAAVCSVAVSVILVVLNWKLCLAIFFAGPVFLIVNRHLAHKVRLQIQEHHRSFHDFSHGIMFMLRSIDLVRLQNTREFEVERQTKRMEGLRESSVRTAWLQAVYGVSQQNMTAALLALMLLVGGWALASHAMSMGSLMSFYFCLSLLSSYLKDLLSAAPLIIAGSEALAELHELLVLADVEPYTGTKRIGFQGNISFDQVRFGYRTEDFLKGINLQLPAGSRVALIGPNGSGKTTLLHLLCGFYKPRAGRCWPTATPMTISIFLSCVRRFPWSCRTRYFSLAPFLRISSMERQQQRLRMLPGRPGWQRLMSSSSVFPTAITRSLARWNAALWRPAPTHSDCTGDPAAATHLASRRTN